MNKTWPITSPEGEERVRDETFLSYCLAAITHCCTDAPNRTISRTCGALKLACDIIVHANLKELKLISLTALNAMLVDNMVNAMEVRKLNYLRNIIKELYSNDTAIRKIAVTLFVSLTKSVNNVIQLQQSGALPQLLLAINEHENSTNILLKIITNIAKDDKTLEELSEYSVINHIVSFLLSTEESIVYNTIIAVSMLSKNNKIKNKIFALKGHNQLQQISSQTNNETLKKAAQDAMDILKD